MKTKSSILIILIALFIIATGAINQNNPIFKGPKGYSFIPPGTAEINGKVKTFQAFYISQTEITNSQYLEFLADLKAKGKTKEYATAKIDTSLWLKVSDGKFFIEAKGSSGVMESETTKVSSVQSKKEITAKFSLNFFHNIVKQADNEKPIIIELRNDAAMRVSYSIGPSKIVFYLAHMIL